MAVPELRYQLSTLFSNYQDTGLLDRIETYALWTIPSVFPQCENTNYGSNTNSTIQYDYQSVGALIVNRLATKLARTLFPANTSFFRIDVTNDKLKALFERKKVSSIIEYENAACERLFYNASYAQLVQAMRLLIITGECLLHRVNDSMRVYSLKNYAVKRNNVGEELDIVIMEYKYFEELDDDIKIVIGDQRSNAPLKLYTRVQRQYKNGVKSWRVTQEINGIALPTNMVYRDKLCPYIPVKWQFVNGDAYARGYVEDYAADFSKLSDLSRELMSYEMESLRLIHMVNPAGGVDIEYAVNAPNGEFVHGDPNMIQPYEGGTFQKIQVIKADLNDIEQRLNVAFMYTGNQREGERITAYEIRQNAEEAEQVLGGVYSQLAESLHLPLAYLLLYEVRKDIILALDAADIKLNILTGIQALSRSTENQGLVIAASEINATVPMIQQFGGKRFNIDAIIDKILLSNGVNVAEITYTEDELRAKAQAEQQAADAQAASMMQQMNPMGQLGTQESAVEALGAARNI